MRHAPAPHALPVMTPVALAACLLLATPGAFAGPQGAVLVSGQATVKQPSATQTDIVQTTPRAVLDWQNFSIAAGERVNVVQPGSSSVLLNRVVGDNPSLIYGSLTANGSVWLINPRGIVFGAGSVVDVGSLVASTLQISGDALAAGRLQLGAGAGGAGELRSEGSINAAAGTVVLAAPQLTHSGQISARRVGLVAATEVLVDVEGDGLVLFNARNSGLDARLSVLGSVRADGGSAEVRAAARAGFADTVLNLDGVVQARSLGTREGRIVIDGGGAGNTIVNGTLDARGMATGERGGQIDVLGQRVGLAGTAVVDASGAAGGGSLRVGGDFQGANATVRNAADTAVMAGAQLRADATTEGDGGRVILWADGGTRFGGALSARGAGSGQGGFAEVSGKETLVFAGSVDLGAPGGRAGTLLLDPRDLTITDQTSPPDLGGDIDFSFNGNNDSTFSKASLNTLLGAGTNVSLATRRNLSIAANGGAVTGTGTASLTLKAGGNVSISAAVTAPGGLTISANDNSDNTATGTGHLVLGAVTLNAGSGTISITDNGSGTAHTFADGAALTAGRALVTGGVALAGASTWTLNDAGQGSSISGALTGAGAGAGNTFTKAGPATLTVGDVNSYSAPITVSGGVLSLGTALDVPDATRAISVSAGATLEFASAGAITLDTADYTVSGAGALRQAGSGTLTINGTSGQVATAGLAVTAGTLLVEAGSTDRIANASTVTVGSGGRLTMANASETVASLVLAGGTVDGTPALTATSFSSSGSSRLLTTVAAGTASVTGGTLTLGNGGATGALTIATIDVADGAALAVNRNNAVSLTNLTGTGRLQLVAGSLTLGGTANDLKFIDVDGGTLQIGAAATLNGSAAATVAAGAVLDLAAASSTVGSLALAGTVTGGTLNTTTLTSSGANALITASVASGGSTVLDGTLTVGSATVAGSLSGPVTISNGATLDYAGAAAAAFGNLLGSGTLRHSGSGTLTLNGSGDDLVAVRLTGTGTLVLADGNGTRIGDNTDVIVGAGTTLTLGDTAETVKSLTLAGTLGGSAALSATTYTLQPGAVVNSALSGGALTVSGNGTATVNGAADVATLEVGNGATLQLGATADLGASTALTVVQGGTLALGASDTTGSLSLSGRLQGVGTLSVGSLTLNAATVVAAIDATGLTSTGATALRAAVQVTGDASVNSGTLTVGDGATAGSLAVSGTTTVQSGATLAVDRNDTVSLGLTVAGLGTLRQAGSGETRITGRAGTALVDVAAGTLSLAAGSADRLSDTADVTVRLGALLRQDSATETIGTLSLLGTLAGSGSLSAGTAAFDGGTLSVGQALVATSSTSVGSSSIAGTLAGDVAVNGGQLTLGGAGRLSSTAVVDVNAGTLRLGGNQTLQTLNLQGTLNASVDSTLTTTDRHQLAQGASVAANVTLAGATVAVTGDAALAGRITTTALQVDGGVLTLGSAGRLGATTGVSVATGAELATGGNETVAALALAGTLSGPGTFTTTGAATLNNGGRSATLLSSASLQANGSVTLDANASTGTATLNTSTLGGTGTLTATGLVSTGNSALALTLDSPTLQVSSGTLTLGAAATLQGSPTATMAGGATLALNASKTFSALAGAGSVSLNAATLTIANAGISSFNGSIGGSGNLVKAGAGNLTLGGTLSHDGSTAVNAGTLTLGAANVLPDGSDLTVAGGATLSTAFNDSVRSLSLTGTLGGGGRLTAANVHLATGALVSTPLGAGVLDVDGAATLNAASGNGTVRVNNGGTLTMGAAGTLDVAAAVTIAVGGTLQLGADLSVDRLQVAGTLSGAFTLSTGANGSTLQAGAVVGSNLAGGNVTVSGNSTLNGRANVARVDVNNGTLTLGATADRIADTATVAVGSAGALALAGNETVGALSLAGTLSGAGTLSSVAEATLDTGASVSANLAAPTLRVTGNSSLSGLATTNTLFVDAGVLTLTAANRLAAGTAVQVEGPGTLRLNAATGVQSLTLRGALTGAGTLTSAVAVTLDGGQLGAPVVAPSLVVLSNSSLGASATVDGLDVSAGTLTIGAAGLLPGAPALNVDGTLLLQAAQTVSTLTGSGTVTLSAVNLTLDLAAAGSFAGHLGGSGGFVKQGAGTLTLSGTHTHGATTLSQGGITLTAANLLPDTAPLTVAGGTTLTLAGNDSVGVFTLSGTLAGTGTLTAPNYVLSGGTVTLNTALGAGTLSSSGHSTLTGSAAAASVTVNGGTLVLASGQRLAAGADVVVSAGSLQLGGAQTVRTLDLSGTLAGAGQTLTATGGSTLRANAVVSANLGAGSLTVLGNASLTGTSATAQLQVGSGTLTLGSAGRLVGNAAITVAGGATLALGGDESAGSLTLTGRLTGGAAKLAAGTYTLRAGAEVSARLGTGVLEAGTDGVAGNIALNATADAGTVTVRGGTLTLGAGDLLNDFATVSVAAGATLTLNGDDTIGTLEASGAINGSGRLNAGSYLLNNATYDIDFGSGDIISRGTTRLNGSSGAAQVTVENGVFTLGAAGRFSNTPAVTVQSGSLVLGGDEAFGSLGGAGSVNIGSFTLTTGGPLDSTFSGALVGTGSLVKTGDSVFTLSGASPFSGSVRVAGGTLALNGTLAATVVQVDSGTTLALGAAERLADGATLNAAGNVALAGNETLTALNLAGTLSGTGTLSAADMLLTGGTVNANLGAGRLVSQGSSQLNGTSAATQLTVSGGTLTLGAAHRFTAAPTTTVAATTTLQLGGDETLGPLGGAGSVQLGAATLSTGGLGNSRFDGVVSGTGSLVKVGSGTLELGAVQAYGGSTTVHAGTLTTTAAAQLPTTTALTVDADATLTLGGAQSASRLDLAGTLSGSGRLSAAVYSLDGGTVTAELGTGRLESVGNSRLAARSGTATVLVNGGTLTLGAANLLDDAAALTVVRGAVLSLGGDDRVGSLLLSGTLAGIGTLTADSVTMDGARVRAGLTSTTLTSLGDTQFNAPISATTLNVDGGLLTLNGAGLLAAAATVNVAGTATLQLGGNESITALNLSGTLSGTGTLTVTNTLLDGGTVLANLGAGALLSRGNSRLAGLAASGTVGVETGTLTLDGASRLTAAPAVSVTGGATLLLGGAQTFGTLAGAGQVDLASFTLTTGSGGDTRFDGVLLGTGGLVKAGVGTRFTLAGNNLYTGATRVAAGTLATAAAERVADASAVTVDTGATLLLGGQERVASLSLAGTLDGAFTLTAASYALAGGTANSALGAGALVSRGNSTLAGTSAAATIDVLDGQLQLAAADRLADGTAVNVARDATLRLAGNDTVASLALAGTLAGSGTLTAATYTLDGATVNAALGAGALTSRGDSRLAATAAASTVDVASGTLTLGAAGRLSAAPAVSIAAGAVLQFGGDETLGTLAGTGTLDLASATLRTGSGGDSRFDGVLRGSGGLVKLGDGRFTLGGNSLYTGSTGVQAGTLNLAGTLVSPQLRVEGGTLQLAAAERLADGATVNVASAGTLSLAQAETITTLQLQGTLAGTGTLTATLYALDGGTASANLGGGTLRSSGNSRVDGSAAATAVFVETGTLRLGAAQRLTAAPALTVAAGATLQLDGDQTVGTLSGAGTVLLGQALLVTGSGGDSRFDGVASGSGALVKQGGSTFTLGGANLYTGTTRVEAGTLALAAAERLADGSALSLAPGATLALGANTETLASATLAGTLAGTGTLAAGSITLDGAQVDARLSTAALVSRGNSTLAGTAAAGTLQVAAGTLTLSSADRLAALPAVTVEGGATLSLGGDQTLGTLAGAGTVALADHVLATGRGGDSRFDGALTGSSGSLVKQGAGSFTLAGSGQFDGPTRVQAGTLLLSGTLASGRVAVEGGTLALAAPERLADGSTLDVSAGATVSLGGNETVAALNLSGTLAGNGTLTAALTTLDGGSTTAGLGAGTLVSRGDSRLAGSVAAATVNVEAGTLTLAAADRLADSAVVTVARGATLALDATDTVGRLSLLGTLAGNGTLTAAGYALDGGTARANLGTGTLSSRGSSTLAGSAAVGTVTVEDGTLTLASAQRLSATPAVTVTAGATLALAGDQVFGLLSGAGELGLGQFTLSTGSGGDSSFSGVISGSGGLVKQGSASTFTLTGASTYTGLTRVAAGRLQLGTGGTSGSVAGSSGFVVDGTLAFSRSDDVALPQAVSGSGDIEQAGSGRLLFSGANKSHTGGTRVASGELATAAAGDLSTSSTVTVAAGARLTLAAAETVKQLDADGSVALGGNLTATNSLLLRGAVSSSGAVALKAGQLITADNAGNRFGGTLSLDAGGRLVVTAGTEGGAARALQLGTVTAADGGRIDAGTMTLTGTASINGGTLELASAAAVQGEAPGTEILGRLATGLPIAFAADGVLQATGSRISVASGATLAVTAANGASVQLAQADNSFVGQLSVVTGTAGTAWQVNATPLSFGGVSQSYAVQSRIRVEGSTINVGGDGLVSDVVSIRADRLATQGATATIVARLPFDSTAGTAVSLPALTLELTPTAFTLPFPFGEAGAANGLRVDIGSQAYGNRTLPLNAGYVTVLPRGGAQGSTAVLLTGPAVNPAGGYRFFFDGAGKQGEIPVFYNGVLPTTPQVENSISATVAVSEGARKQRFEEAVRTENVAVRLRAGVIAEVGPAPSATQGTEGIRVPLTCPPAASLLSCGTP